MYPAPIVPARLCPVEMQPKAAALLVRRAEAADWKVRCTMAIGFRVVGRSDSGEYKPVRSVLVRAVDPSRRKRISALWVGNPDGSSMKFDGAWRMPGKLGIPDRLPAAEVKGEIL